MSAGLPIVLFGAAGGLGRRVLAMMPGDHEVIPVDRALDPPYDLADPGELSKLAKHLPRRLIGVNVMGAVSTAVDPDAVAASVRNNVQSAGVIVSGLGDRLEHLVHLSSISVYGIPSANPITEDHPLRPNSVYGISKSAGELLVKALCSNLDGSLTVIRATQLFALPSAGDALPHVLARRLRGGETPTLTADPRSRRDYLHVDDAARLIVQTALARRAGIFNAGSGGGVLLGELFAAAYEAAGQPPAATPSDGRDISQWLDIRATQDAFAWTPTESVLDWVRASVMAGDG
jgi:nucleoside-diphosphate-sugar epimerase